MKRNNTLNTVRKGAPWLIIAVVVATALAIGAHRNSTPGSLADRARAIAAGVRCPSCQGETAAESQVFAAKAIRSDIATRLNAGQSAAQIRSYLVSRYGPGILESPPTTGVSALVWIVPVVVSPLAAAALVVGFRRSGRRLGPVGRITTEDRELVDRALRATTTTSSPGSERLTEESAEPAATAVGDSGVAKEEVDHE